MRKTIQPVRTRTPTIPLTSDERRGTIDTSSLSESSTPQRRPGPRKKISTYFSKPTKSPEDTITEIWSSGTSADNVSAPDITMMVDAIFIKLCNRPFDGLPAQMNSSILHIIEAYRGLSFEKEHVDDQLKETAGRLEEVEKTWENEELAFRAEIKRLELIIARGKNGMSRLMASRQESVVNRKRYSRTQAATIMPVSMETAAMKKHEGHSENSQQGKKNTSPSALESVAESIAFLVPSISPSSRERVLSIQLFSAVNHDIPVGTPPQENLYSAFGKVPGYKNGPKEPSVKDRFSLPGNESLGTDVSKQSSASGDNVPTKQGNPGTSVKNDMARDFQDIKYMASAIAESRGLRVEQILPKLIELFDNAEEQLEIPAKSEAMQRTPTGPQIRRPPSWIPGDDTSAWVDAGTIPTIRPPLRTLDSFASSRCETMSDLSASSSDESEGDSALKRPSKIPSPTHDKGLARSRQEQRSSVVTVVGGPGRLETELLSSSASSRRTAFRNSSDRLDSTAALGPRLLQQKPQMSSRHSLLVSTAQGGATSSPDAPTADSTAETPQKSSPPPVTGRTSGQLSLRQKTNQVDSAVGVADARSARSSETTVSRTDPVKDGARQWTNQKRTR